MTWTAYFGGHFQPWDEEAEKKVADVFAGIVEELKQYGVATATFSGNYHQRNFLALEVKP